MLWPVGAWDMKSELYASLRKTIDGPNADGVWPMGAMRFPDACDADYFKQLTAEHLALRDLRNGTVAREWVRERGQANEAHDIAVYARALAHHLTDHLSPTEWATLAANRGVPPEAVQRDLATLWASAPMPVPGVGPQRGLRGRVLN